MPVCWPTVTLGVQLGEWCPGLTYCWGGAVASYMHAWSASIMAHACMVGQYHDSCMHGRPVS